MEDNINPCQPSPCGSNAQCREANGHAVCSCLPNYIGIPPYCKPECIQDSDCPSNLACKNMKCQDPCPGLCGINAECSVIYHKGICRCQSQYTGDPFYQCTPIPCKLDTFRRSLDYSLIIRIGIDSICTPRDCNTL